MRKKSEFILILGLLLCIQSTACVTDIEDPEPPHAPKWILPDRLKNFPKEGIRPAEGSDILHLAWQPPVDGDIESYSILRSDLKAGKYVEIAAITLTDGQEDFSYNDETVTADSAYYYYSVARDYAGNESPASDTIRIGLLQSPKLREFGAPVSPTPNFRWEIVPPESTAGFFTVEIADQKRNILFRSSVLARTSYGGTETWTATIDSLETGNRYYWRVYAFGLVDDTNRPHALSLSEWVGFEVAG